MQLPSQDIVKLGRLLEKLDDIYQEYRLSASGWVYLESGNSVYVTFDDNEELHGIEMQ